MAEEQGIRRFSLTSLTFWLLLFFEIVVVLVFVPGSFIQDQTVIEGRWTKDFLGKAASDEIRQMADLQYETIAGKTHLEQHIRSLFIPSQEQIDKSVGLEDLGHQLWPWFSKCVDNLMDILYLAMRRLAVAWLWIPLIVPGLLLAAFNGWKVRAIKKQEFGYTSPVLHHFGLKAMKVLYALLVLELVFPMAVPPQLIPTLLLSSCLFLGLSVSNVQKRI